MRKLTVNGRDIADYAIVLKPIPAPAEKTAAEFLQNVIETACGVTLPIADTAEYGICLGTRGADSRVKWDGFRIASDEKNLYLDGNIPRGTFYSAVRFAEKYLGYRYYAADCKGVFGEGEDAIPAGIDMIDNPVFEVRFSSNMDLVGNPERCAFAGINYEMGAGAERYGGEAVSVIHNHSFYKYCSGEEYAETHPEYFALHDGKRHPCYNGGSDGQLCLTNPDVLRIVTENVLKTLREHPEMTLLDLSQGDNYNYCQCDACRAVDEEEESHSGTLIRFVNAVAEAVEKEFPHVMVQTFAYQYTRVPPKLTKARPNVMIRYCTIEACFRHALNDPNCEWNGPVYGKELLEWQKKADHLSIWDYTTNFNCYLAPFPNLRSLFLNMRFLADCHAIHIYGESDCFGHNASGVYAALKAYLIGKLYWNPYMTEEEYDRHINEFLAAYYGGGWREIRRYIELEHDMTDHHHISCWEYMDIQVEWAGSAVEQNVPGIKRFMRRNYEVKPYQPVYPEGYLNKLSEHMDEILAMWNKAYDMAETEVQKMHVDRSRVSIHYMELVTVEHNEDCMTPEEKAAHEANVAQFLADKEKYKLFYSIQTIGRGR